MPPDEPIDAPPEPAPNGAEEKRPKTGSGRTRTGKVARLPKAVRDRLNNMLLDGVTHKQAILNLGEDGKELTDDHISSWKTEGGYSDWLREKQFLDTWRAKWEFAQDLTAQNN